MRRRIIGHRPRHGAVLIGSSRAPLPRRAHVPASACRPLLLVLGRRRRRRWRDQEELCVVVLREALITAAARCCTLLQSAVHFQAAVPKQRRRALHHAREEAAVLEEQPDSLGLARRDQRRAADDLVHRDTRAEAPPAFCEQRWHAPPAHGVRVRAGAHSTSKLHIAPTYRQVRGALDPRESRANDALSAPGLVAARARTGVEEG
eukprot:7387928-Prymnesium_polylepis.2